MNRARAAAAVLALTACVEPASCPPADLAPIDGEPSYAMAASDYASSAVGVLDARGEILREAWIDSGTVEPRIVPAVSGDIVLASRPLAPCVVAIVDRSGTDVLTFLDACASEDVVLGQLDVGPTFYANPQDVVGIDDTRALVSRSEPNLLPDAPEMERGNDLLVVDWHAGQVLGRVSLDALDSMGGERAYARPGRLALLERGEARVVVAGLARLTRDFMVPGPGAVAIVDVATLEARALAMEGLTNCHEVDAVPGAPAHAIVTCNGAPFSTVEGRRDGAGVVAIELDERGDVHVRARWRAADHPGAPVFNTWSVPLSAEQVVTIAMGGGSEPDRAGLITLGAGATVLFEAERPFVLGDGAYDPVNELLLIPDAHDGVIRRFAMGEQSELAPVLASRCRGLPPREIRPIVQ